jgi:sucrose-6-phosphate hydrolase SacC (GH32 family)
MGHLTTVDFQTYRYHGPILTPDPKLSQPDSLSIWAGSTIKIDKITYLFYTLLQKQSENPLEQTIGFAASRDLFSFHKHPGNPILRPPTDGHYSVASIRQETGTRDAFRDPFPFRINDEKIYIAFSAQTNEGLYDACVGLACATLGPEGPKDWMFLDPVFCPYAFAEIELPYLICMRDHWFL